MTQGTLTTRRRLAARAASLLMLALAMLAGPWWAVRAAPEAPLDARSALQAAKLRINEIDYDQPGGDDSEFVEIFNPGAEDVSLDGVHILGVNHDGTIYDRESLPADILAAGDYYVVGMPGVAGLDHEVAGSSWLQNGAPDAVALVANDGTDPADDVLLDSVSYEGAVPGGPPSGGSWTEGTAGATADDSAYAHVGLGRLPDGDDTEDNAVDLVLVCITPGEPNVEGPVDQCDSPSGPTPTKTPDPAIVTPTPTIAPIEPTATPAAPSPTPTVLPEAGDLAIELEHFGARRTADGVRIGWRTLAEIDHAAFRVWRAPADGSSPAVLVAPSIRPRGGTFEGATYVWTDRDPPAVAVHYWLEDVDTLGRTTRHGPVWAGPRLMKKGRR